MKKELGPAGFTVHRGDVQVREVRAEGFKVRRIVRAAGFDGGLEHQVLLVREISSDKVTLRILGQSANDVVRPIKARGLCEGGRRR